ncbi:MAG: HAD-IIB family hydrolase [Clostridiales bacterium]|nr:HAD-IIB family hydrolase [Clostridiales bacterium]
MKRKLVAFDADGTIIDYNVGGVVVESTRKAITELKEAGHIPVILTGRSYNMIDRLGAELGIEYLGVLNGAQIFRRSELVYSKSLGEELSMILLEKTKDLNLPVLAFDEKYVYYRNISDRWREFVNASINMESNMIPLGKGPCDFASFYTYGDEKLLADRLSDVEGIEFHNNRHEISAVGVNKGNALLHLAKLLEISAKDTVAFGDGINDISMLKAAGIGVAIQSGNPLAHEAADIVTEKGPDAIYTYLHNKKFI